MNETKKLIQLSNSFNSRYLLIIVFLLHTAHADTLPPPLPEEYTQKSSQERISPENNVSVLKKIKNFVINIFVPNKKPAAKINQELNENLAELAVQDKSKDIGKLTSDQLNKSSIKDEHTTNNDLDLISQDTSEIITIPSLPDDKPAENKSSSNQWQSKADAALNQNNLISESDNKKINDAVVINNKADDKVSVVDVNANKVNPEKINMQTLELPADTLLQELNDIKKSKSTVTIGSKSLKKNIVKEIEPSAISENKSVQVEDITQEQNKFIIDEAKVLLLPEDDIVLGQISAEAKSEIMDDYAYMNHFEANFISNEESLEHERLVKFIDNYNDNFHHDLSRADAFDRAIKAINMDDLYELKALIDNYSILQKKDEHGRNLLHLSIELGQYATAKFLIMRGIDMNARDNFQNSPLSLAKKFSYDDIIFLLKKAGAK